MRHDAEVPAEAGAGGQLELNQGWFPRREY